MVPAMCPAAETLSPTAGLASAAGSRPDEAPADMLERARGLVHGGHLDEAWAICEAVWPQVHLARDMGQMGMCLYVRSLCHQYRGALSEAVDCGYRAIEWFDRAGDSARLPRLMALQAICVARVGEAASALELLGRGISLLPMMSHSPVELCAFWNNAASTYQVMGRLQQAVEAGERALALVGEHDDRDLAALCVGNLLAYRLQWVQEQRPGVASAELLDTVAAMKAHMAEQVEAGRHHLVSYCSTICADALIAIAELDEARQVLQRGSKSALAAGVGPDRATLELRLASVERLSGQYRTAASHIAVAHELAAQSHDQELLARVYLENSRLNEAKNQWRAALDCHKTYAEIQQSWLRAQADSRAQALAVRAEVERLRVEAEMLRLRAPQP